MTQPKDSDHDDEPPFEPSDELNYEAYVWLVRMTSGEVSEEDMVKFLRWRDASDENLIAISKATILWNALGDLKTRESTSDDLDDSDQTPVSPGPNLTLQ